MNMDDELTGIWKKTMAGYLKVQHRKRLQRFRKIDKRLHFEASESACTQARNIIKETVISEEE
jgi:predicted nucleic acid-binding OB-fold protein